MADRIKGITVEIGGDTQGLSKALSGVNKEIRDTQSQLKDVERLLKMDPGNTELLRQKYELLNRSVEQTESKLEALREAEQQVQRQFERGDIGEDQYNALRREIIATEANLRNIREEAQQTENALNGIAGSSLEDVADAADAAGEAMEDAGDSASDFGDFLKAETIVEGAKAIIGVMKDLAEETKEYQKIMGSLEVSSEKAGYNADQTADIYKRLYGILGDDQTAATTTANLQALGVSQGDLVKLTDMAAGAWATYGDSIPIDGLAESINETVKAGQVTGTFADVLNWGSKEGETFGVTLKENTEANKEWNDAVNAAATAEDFFNLALQDAGSEAERANIVMQAMADQGLAEAGKAWRENNEALVENNEAQANFQENMAQLSEKVMPIVNAMQEGVNLLLEAFVRMTEGVDTEMIAAKIEEGFGYFINEVLPRLQEFISLIVDNKEVVISALAGIAGGLLALKLAAFAGQIASVISGTTTLAATFPTLASAIGLLTNPIFLVSTAIVGLVVLIAQKGDEIQALLQKLDDFLQGVFVTDWTQVFGPIMGSVLNGFFKAVEGVWNSVKKILDGIIDFIRGVFTGNWERAWNGVKEIFGGIFGGLEALAKGPINAIIGLVNGAIGGLNMLINGANKIPGVNIPEIGTIPYLAKGGILTQGSAIVGEAGPELLTMAGNRAIVQPLTNQTTTNNMGGVNIYVYGAPGQDIKELAELVSEKISDTAGRMGAVYR